MKKVGGTSPNQLLCDKKMACEINKVLDSISNIEETECQNKLNQIKGIIESTHNTRSMSEICKVIEGGKSKPKSKSKTKKKNYKKKTKTRRKNKRKRTKRRKTYKIVILQRGRNGGFFSPLFLFEGAARKHKKRAENTRH